HDDRAQLSSIVGVALGSREPELVEQRPQQRSHELLEAWARRRRREVLMDERERAGDGRENATRVFLPEPRRERQEIGDVVACRAYERPLVADERQPLGR